METEEALEEILNERLFIRRKGAAAGDVGEDKENMDGGARGRRPAGAAGGGLREITNRAAPPGLTKELSLEGSYHGRIDDTRDAMDVIDNVCVKDAVDVEDTVKKTEAPCDCRAIQTEFDKFKAAHLETLKMKSRIYRFINGEILRLENDYRERTRGLEEENARLRGEAERLAARYGKFKEYVAAGIERMRREFVAALRRERAEK